MELRFRGITKQDFDAIYQLEKRCFDDAWPPEAFSDFMLESSWLVETDERLIGFILYYTALDEAMIINFAVHPEYRRQGLGYKLLEDSLKALIKRGYCYFYLDVRRSNEAAIRLYMKFGFSALGYRKNYYQSPPEDALVMGLSTINEGATIREL